MPCGAQRGLGRAVQVPDSDVRAGPAQPCDGGEGHHVPAGEQLAQPAEGGRRLLGQHPEAPGRQMDGGHAACDRLPQALRVDCARFGDQDAGTADQRRPDLEQRRVERVRGVHQYAVIGIERPAGVAGQSRDASVRHRDALGLPGRSRRVHHVGDVARRDRRRLVPRSPGPRHVHGHGLDPVRHRVPGRLGADRHRHAGVGQHPLDPYPRVVHLHRDVRGPGLPDREECDEQVRAALHHHADVVAAPHAHPGQMPCQPVRFPVEVAVGQGAVPIDDGHRVRRARRAPPEQFHHRRTAGGLAGRVPVLHHGRACDVTRHAQAAHGNRGLGRHPFDDTHDLPGDLGGGRLVDPVGPEGHADLQALSGTDAHGQRVAGTGPGEGRADRDTAVVAEAGCVKRVVLDHHDGVEDRARPHRLLDL